MPAKFKVGDLVTRTPFAIGPQERFSVTKVTVSYRYDLVSLDGVTNIVGTPEERLLPSEPQGRIGVFSDV